MHQSFLHPFIEVASFQTLSLCVQRIRLRRACLRLQRKLLSLVSVRVRDYLPRVEWLDGLLYSIASSYIPRSDVAVEDKAITEVPVAPSGQSATVAAKVTGINLLRFMNYTARPCTSAR